MKFQVLLAKMAFFVNYDGLLCQHGYVNKSFDDFIIFIIFNYFSISGVDFFFFVLNIDFAIFLSLYISRVSNTYLFNNLYNLTIRYFVFFRFCSST